jgi:hypothetical protein
MTIEYLPEPEFSLGISGLSILDNAAEPIYSLPTVGGEPFEALVLDSLGVLRFGQVQGTFNEAQVRLIVDSDYVQARQVTGITLPLDISVFINDAGYLDSSTVSSVVDSDYVETRAQGILSNVSTSFTFIDDELSNFSPNQSDPKLLVLLSTDNTFDRDGPLTQNLGAVSSATWSKISWPKSITSNNRVIYFNIRTIANNPSGGNQPALYTFLSQTDPSVSGGPYIKTWTGQLDGSVSGSGDADNTYVFMNVNQDPSNSNNYAVWFRQHFRGNFGLIKILIAGYMA